MFTRSIVSLYIVMMSSSSKDARIVPFPERTTVTIRRGDDLGFQIGEYPCLFLHVNR